MSTVRQKRNSPPVNRDEGNMEKRLSQISVLSLMLMFALALNQPAGADDASREKIGCGETVQNVLQVPRSFTDLRPYMISVYRSLTFGDSDYEGALQHLAIGLNQGFVPGSLRKWILSKLRVTSDSSLDIGWPMHSTRDVASISSLLFLRKSARQVRRCFHGSSPCQGCHSLGGRGRRPRWHLDPRRYRGR